MLDDGALRFLKSNGDAIDNVMPGCVQPRGDWRQAADASEAPFTYRGDRMDYGLAVDILIRLAIHAKDVPAGTSMTHRGALQGN